MVNAVLVERNINAIHKKAAAASRLDVVIIVDPCDEIFVASQYDIMLLIVGSPFVRTYAPIRVLRTLLYVQRHQRHVFVVCRSRPQHIKTQQRCMVKSETTVPQQEGRLQGWCGCRLRWQSQSSLHGNMLHMAL